MKKIVLLGDSIRLIGYGTKVPEMLEDFYSREFGRLTGKSQFNYVAVFTERKEFFPVMSKKIQVKRIFTGDNWREILKL